MKIKRSLSNFKIMTMSRGYTDEADKILNSLEHGVFDALEKRYLRSFVFAIYLDAKDPNNIVEAYTFNIQYHSLPGSNVVVPIMTLGDELRNLSLGGKADPVDPMAEAVKKGKAPTLRDVKLSVKRMLKALIQATNNMEPLPKRRFAAFKLFYTDDAPSDYEPPHFQPGDQEKNKWYFMTHDMDEVPDKWSLGKLETGHHSVDLDVRSVVSFLPSSTQDDDAPFTGVTPHTSLAPKLTPMQEALSRVQEAELQSSDAEERRIAWAADELSIPEELHDFDAESEDDPDYMQDIDGEYKKVVRHITNAEVVVPVGRRSDTGKIVPIPPQAVLDAVDMDLDEAYFGGVAETIPSRIGDLHMKKDHRVMEQTQALENTQLSALDDQLTPTSRQIPTSSTYVPNTASLRSEMSSLPPSTRAASSAPGDLDPETQITDDMPDSEDAEMLDMETQVLPFGETQVNQSGDTIESYGNGTDSNARPVQEDERHEKDLGLMCECSIKVEDGTELCFCEAGCGRWYHVWCMGYHAASDKRMPVKFVCFDCTLRADPGWELIEDKLYPEMLTKFQELSLFRRAIKIAETQDPSSEREFSKFMGCQGSEGRQLFRRLQDEKFVVMKETTVNELGLTETTTRTLRKGKKTKQANRTTVQKTLGFDRISTKSAAYSDYFNPDPKVVRRMLKLPALDAGVTAKALSELTTNAPHAEESQTQEDIPMVDAPAFPAPQARRKRGPPESEDIRPKKIKISVTTGVDLAE
ncbi:hypothetical protein HGRIS_012763 [Hohenbuehelia grisea]|uniref:HORMA domain-containing protein n=1 Tax=Hohenbuehelia grisea TaxID=104357 RepID=A0ABR3ITG6_9AGAR